MKRFLSYLQSVNKLALVIFLVCVVIGTYGRATNLLHLGFVFDLIQTQFAWAEAGIKYGYGAFWRDYYDTFDYLPSSLIYIIFEGWLARLFDQIIPGDRAQAFVTVTKSLNWIIEIILAYVIAKISIDYAKISKSKALILAGFIYAIPSLWFVSGVWGQIDSIVVLLAILSMWLMYKSRERKSSKIFRNYIFWSGVVFALAFWFKPQIVLTIPAVLLFHFVGKDGGYVLNVLKQVVLWMFSFGLIVLIGLYLYFNTTGSVGFINVLISIFLVIILIYSYRKYVKTNDEWREIATQGFGFWVSSFLILILPLLYYAPKVMFVLALPYLKADDASSGAANFWPLIGEYGKGSDKLFNIYGFGPSVSLTANLLFVLFCIFFYWKFYGKSWSDLKQTLSPKFSLDELITKIIPRSFNLTQFVLLTSVVSSTFFLFMTKMHSRYLIWGLIFSLLALGLTMKNRNWKYLLLTLVIMNIGFTFNQLGIYSAWNSNPTWVSSALGALRVNEGNFSSTFNFVGILGLYLWTWLNWRDFETENKQ